MSQAVACSLVGALHLPPACYAERGSTPLVASCVCRSACCTGPRCLGRLLPFGRLCWAVCMAIAVARTLRATRSIARRSCGIIPIDHATRVGPPGASDYRPLDGPRVGGCARGGLLRLRRPRRLSFVFPRRTTRSVIGGARVNRQRVQAFARGGCWSNDRRGGRGCLGRPAPHRAYCGERELQD